MDSISQGLFPSPRSTRILAMRKPSDTILKAPLALRPQNRGEVTMLLLAIALLDGVRAALAVGESSTSSCRATRCRALLDVFSDPRTVRRRHDVQTGKDKFGEFERRTRTAAGPCASLARSAS